MMISLLFSKSLKQWPLLILLMLFGKLAAQNPLYQLVGDTICSGNEVIGNVRAMHFDNMSSAQFSMTWDSILLTFEEVIEINPLLLNPIFNVNKIESGKLGFSWIDLSTQGVDISAETVLFKIKWKSLLDTSMTIPLEFGNDPVLIESSRLLVQVPSDLESGTIKLLNPFVESFTNSPATTNEMDGNLSIEVAGGQAPYQFLWSNQSTLQNPINLAAGNYFCTITDNQQCQNVVGPFLVDQQTSTLDQEILEELSVTPNPVINDLHINAIFKTRQKGTLKILDIQGRFVYEISFSDDIILASIDLSSQAPGLYFVVIQIGEEQLIEQIIKQ